MSFTYMELTNDDRKQLLTQRAKALEADHYGHQMNMDALAGLPHSLDKAAAVQAATEAQVLIEAAVTMVRDELAHLARATPFGPTTS